LSSTVVSDDMEAKPVRRARLTCTAPELKAGLTAVTDDRGRFNCARLPPGRYTVNVTRDGWVPASYGAKRPLRAGTPIPLAAGQHAEIVVRMMRGAVITGTLLDENGQPAVNARVVALRSMMQYGERRLVALGVPGVSDDRGVYRIYGLAPGDYLVGRRRTAERPSCGPPPTWTCTTHAPQSGHRRRQIAALRSRPRIFLERRSDAGVCNLLRPGEERSGGLRPATHPHCPRGGTLSTPDGGPMPSNAQLTLLASAQTAFPGVAFDGLRTTHVPADGGFSFGGISPGVYTLLARATLSPGARAEGSTRDGAPQVLWASTEIAVDGERVSGVALTLQPALTLSGQVRFEGTRLKPPATMTSIRITAEPVQPPEASRCRPRAPRWTGSDSLCQA
jgi:hypothetical protein